MTLLDPTITQQEFNDEVDKKFLEAYKTGATGVAIMDDPRHLAGVRAVGAEAVRIWLACSAMDSAVSALRDGDVGRAMGCVAAAAELS